MQSLEHRLNKEAKKAIRNVSLPVIVSLENAIPYARKLYNSQAQNRHFILYQTDNSQYN